MENKPGKKNTSSKLSQTQLQKAMTDEGKLFEEYYVWLENHMPTAFFEEFDHSKLMTIAHNLMGFHQQGKFIQIHFDNCSIVLCEESPDADIKILKHYTYFGIQNYQTFISDEPPPLLHVLHKLRIAIIHFSNIDEGDSKVSALSDELQDETFKTVVEQHPNLSREDFDSLLKKINARFLRVLTKERLTLILNMYLRSLTRDHLQYEVRYNEDWKESKKDISSLQIVFAWRNTQKNNFLYRLAKLIHRHKLVMKRVNAAYLNPYSSKNTLLMSLAIHGQGNKSAWEVTDVKDFLQELATLKYFEDRDYIEQVFVSTGLLRGNIGNLLRTITDITHQLLLHADVNLYSHDKVEEGLCRHPEITVKICEMFEKKFHPELNNTKEYGQLKNTLLELVEKLDTGNLIIDQRRKNILKQAIYIIDCTDKTNFYRNNKSAIALRLGPRIMATLPYDRSEKFPEDPFAIFFLKGKSFIAFHIRFKDLARGGIRSVFPRTKELAMWEKNNIFSECYNLAYTQQKKNKDIPEGGSKAVVFIEPLDDLKVESQIYQKELLLAKMDEDEVAVKLDEYNQAMRNVFLYQSQRSFVYTTISLVNCDDDGTLKARDVIDYYKKPEYLYFGPDENMHDVMIEWIAEHSVITDYKAGKALISSKPSTGINHKMYGVTSLGVNVCMHKMLERLGINPETDEFTVKISGGPDGDVAGNQILNLHRFYPKTAKLVGITDVSGTMYDPVGLDLEEMVKLFHNGKSIHEYPDEKLSEGSFHLHMWTKRDESAYQQQTACNRMVDGKIQVEWMLGSDAHHTYSHNLHQIPADVFVPAGGRPRTLNASNWKDYLDITGEPSSRAIVEGANLYLTGEARANLEAKGVFIIKDSSANKGGVICSSLEVLCGLLMRDEEFLEHKDVLMEEILQFIRDKAGKEADLLINTQMELKKPMTDISDLISRRMNTYMYQILDYLTEVDIARDMKNPLNQCLLNYSPKFLSENYKDRFLDKIPKIHLKAMIACHISSKIVYTKGLSWSPSIVDILPLIINGINDVP